MIDYTRFRTGYDLEIMLGADYFRTALMAGYDARALPQELAVADGVSLHLQRRFDVVVVLDETDADLSVTLQVEAQGPSVPDWYRGTVLSMTVGLAIDITTTSFDVHYVWLDQQTHDLIDTMARLLGLSDSTGLIDGVLGQALQLSIPVSLAGSSVVELVTRKVPADGDHQAAYAIYVNLDLQISEENAPETSVIARGDASLGVSFLPADKAFAYGSGEVLFDRLARHVWHGFYRDRAEGSDHPVMDGGHRVGRYESVHAWGNPGPADRVGHIGVRVRSVIILENWPDADVEVVIHVTPYIDRTELKFSIRLIKLESDTGALGDIFGFVLGLLVGGTVGLLFGPVGVGVGASLGSVGGAATVTALEVSEAASRRRQLEERIRGSDFLSALSAFPQRLRLFVRTTDPFYLLHYEVMSIYDETWVDAPGMGFVGRSALNTVREPLPVELIDKTRGTGEGALSGISSLTYRVGGEVHSLLVEDVLRRIPAQELAPALLHAMQVHRVGSVVADIRFDTGLELHTHEAIALQRAGILRVAGFRIVDPVDAAAYYRAEADGRLDNNFEALPEVGLRWICFNHDTASHHADALNIRRSREIDVPLPEWGWMMTEPTDSPAAYAVEAIAGNTVTIRARFEGMSETPDGSIVVRATGGGILGAVDPQFVRLVNGAGEVELELRHCTIGTGGVFGVLREDISWNWEYRFDDEPWRRMCISHHRIYVVRRTPSAPWVQESHPNSHNPWTDALDLVCTSLSAPSPAENAIDGLARSVCEWLSSGTTVAENPGRFRYDTEGEGASFYTTSSDAFRLTSVIARLDGEDGRGELVDGTDCACMVSTFANLLGCDLVQGRFDVSGMNPVLPIGHERWWLGGLGFESDAWGPRPVGQLLWHEVAWKEHVAGSQEIYDICFTLNAEEDPARPQRPDPQRRSRHHAFGVPFSRGAELDYFEKVDPLGEFAESALHPATRRRLW